MDQRTTRRSFTALLLATPLAALTVSSCGGSSGPGAAAGNGPSMWILTGQPAEGIRTDAVNAFNEANPDQEIALSSFQNDAYKAKIRTAIGADQAPTIIPTWGGGGLRDYVRNGQVEDLTGFFAENAELQEKLFASAFAAATVDGKVYAVPCEVVSPIVLFHNKRVFEQVGAQPPTTWDELMALVPVFNAAGIAPFSLGGQSRWTNMMWLEYLYDRIGGAELFTSIYDGEPGAWSKPASIDALTKLQDLVRADGFIKGFASITADSNADQALLFSDKAAMMLHGSWVYGSMKTDGGDFVTGGHLGFTTFPVVTGGAGDPTATVGNPAGYYAMSAKADEEAKTAAKRFFAEGLVTEATTAAWVESGSVPIVVGSDRGFAGSEDEEWLQFVYDLASGASTFQQSWDQALSPTAAEALLENIEKLFGLTQTPQQFAEAMEAAGAA
ncbi:raffinose/stachyose/melibiose transport system substrate-binding protein [Kineococcus radiotolerans]|uniref:Extracellular solute-binding protein family 1 n=2 Tax=Kineococcus radiotolerans TaxID=131568 RepID=A6WDZ7_KINRD|nr:extracellular solute-binding protein [Kineococcus radiotolerans]ABS05036.1 extracellular solute-binding protein family 1 [Kineococcus radiotolerans SRS30216 = ATCC BAA-149]MBB2901886.1 raffinose/stachyose/melibiose transport system substrate-binding protein [Kineococcus radiotolerans]